MILYQLLETETSMYIILFEMHFIIFFPKSTLYYGIRKLWINWTLPLALVWKLDWIFQGKLCWIFLFECLNIIVDISSFSSLNTNVSTTQKYYRKQALNKNLKLIREVMKILQKCYPVRKSLALRSPMLRKTFLKIFKTLQAPLLHT